MSLVIRPVLLCDYESCTSEHVGRSDHDPVAVRAEARQDGWSSTLYETDLRVLDFCCPRHALDPEGRASDNVICGDQHGQFVCDFTPGHRGAHAARRTTREIVATWDEDES